MAKRAIIFVNGHLPELEAARRLIHPEDTLIAADGGTRHILALGLLPSVVIGDLDSLTIEEKQRLEESRVEIRQCPPDKDETDLELALRLALDAGYCSTLVLAALGGRLDQTLSNLALLTAPSLADVDVRLDDGIEEAFFVRDRAAISGKPGDTVSLIPWGGEVTGVTTDGLRWPLRDASLSPHHTRGISNELLAETATISLKSGLLLVTHRRNQRS